MNRVVCRDTDGFQAGIDSDSPIFLIQVASGLGQSNFRVAGFARIRVSIGHSLNSCESSYSLQPSLLAVPDH